MIEYHISLNTHDLEKNRRKNLFIWSFWILTKMLRLLKHKKYMDIISILWMRKEYKKQIVEYQHLKLCFLKLIFSLVFQLIFILVN